MTTTFRTIIMAHFVNCKIDDPVTYLSDQGSIKPKTVENYFRSGNHPVGSVDGLSVQIAWWLIGESRDAIEDDAPLVPNPVEKFLQERLDEYHGKRARLRRAKNPRDRRKAKQPRGGKGGQRI